MRIAVIGAGLMGRWCVRALWRDLDSSQARMAADAGAL